ncbi:helix-turn-helix transcriptional regulator [Micromonospora sp. WMMD812]|uniref:PadR family transcriptional regulator n=1 Tax=Micromonospora sp. WMMD812 TaxID=3015152 RepID=UPI00248C5E89|nr:helix-turn-helix transcriptional regulator [Micromonospora sp. WMMD812]WBB66984.1 helix-turn-helix transcriptional regulator [Micromonospora sp. WMMD812]
MEPLGRIGAATVDVLQVLLDSDRPRWGLEVIKTTGRPSGSVYPLLERLEQHGWVVSSWEVETERRGPRRRLYELTVEGAQEARRVCARATARGVTPRPFRPREAG